MGAVRHRQIISLLSLVVALQMAVGIVTIAVRMDDTLNKSALFAGSVRVDPRNDGILAGGNFDNRRGSGGSTNTTRATGAPSTVATSLAPATTAPSPTTGPAATTPTTAVPGTTATTARPATTATTPPAAGATTPSSGRAGTGGSSGPTTATSGPAATGAKANNSNVQTDPAGDTFVDGTQNPIKEPKADIVRAGAVYEPGKISLAMQLAQPVDPSKDAKWAGDSTYADWSLDTNGDGTPDFDVQYYFDAGEIGGTVSRPGSEDTVCDADSAGYSPDGYWLTVPASCLGNPASFSYRVTMYYDTNPKDANADVASDVTPNGGMSFPVSRP